MPAFLALVNGRLDTVISLDAVAGGSARFRVVRSPDELRGVGGAAVTSGADTGALGPAGRRTPGWLLPVR